MIDTTNGGVLQSDRLMSADAPGERQHLLSGGNLETDSFQKSAKLMSEHLSQNQASQKQLAASLPGKDSFQSGSQPSLMPDRDPANVSGMLDSDSESEVPVPPVINFQKKEMIE